MRKQPLTDEEFQTIYSKVPRLCVDILVKKSGGVVLTRRNSNAWKGRWNLPGGTIHYRETIAAAVARILQEEMGVEGRILREIAHIEYFSEVEERGYGYSISMVFECVIEGELPEINEDGEEIKIWYSLPEIVTEEQREIITEMLEKYE